MALPCEALPLWCCFCGMEFLSLCQLRGVLKVCVALVMLAKLYLFILYLG